MLIFLTAAHLSNALLVKKARRLFLAFYARQIIIQFTLPDLPKSKFVRLWRGALKAKGLLQANSEKPHTACGVMSAERFVIVSIDESTICLALVLSEKYAFAAMMQFN